MKKRKRDAKAASIEATPTLRCRRREAYAWCAYLAVSAGGDSAKALPTPPPGETSPRRSLSLSDSCPGDNPRTTLNRYCRDGASYQLLSRRRAQTLGLAP